MKQASERRVDETSSPLPLRWLSAQEYWGKGFALPIQGITNFLPKHYGYLGGSFGPEPTKNRLSAVFRLLLERNSEVFEELGCFRFGLCGRHDGDGKSEDVLEVFVGSLREDGVFLDTNREVTHLINT